jgi:thioester reductase-like protein
MADPTVAIGSGYPESKWVAERVLTLAAENTAFSPIIVRIGQLSGGRNGSWNPSEWVPSIVRSGQILGCLPRASGVCDVQADESYNSFS